MGEGALLVDEPVISDTLRFAKNNNAHFITGAQDKRRIPKDQFLSLYSRRKNRTEMDIYHDRMTKEVFDIFCRDEAFKEIYDNWSSDFSVTTQNHIPDIWGRNGLWLKIANRFYPQGRGRRTLKLNLSKLSGLFFWYNQLASRVSVSLADCFPENNNGNNYDEFIYVNGKRTRLRDVVDFKQEGKIKFHKDNAPEWFGCCCNHFVSREFLEKFSERLEKYNIYESLTLPFCADALEVIWGMVPLWFGYDKWFFNGIHRIRRNFITHRREADPEGAVRYLNRHYAGKINVNYEGDFIKIAKLGRNFRDLKQSLNKCYF